jgi:hypothetical protein
MKHLQKHEEGGHAMKLGTIAGIISLGSALFSGSVMAYDCNGLPKWKRQAYYLVGAQVPSEISPTRDTHGVCLTIVRAMVAEEKATWTRSPYPYTAPGIAATTIALGVG